MGLRRVRPELGDLRHRFEELAAKVGERARQGGRPGSGPSQLPLSDDYWRAVQELFTRDVSASELRDLFHHESQDAFKFFTRDVDFTTLTRERWYQRYPHAAWKVFLDRKSVV